LYSTAVANHVAWRRNRGFRDELPGSLRRHLAEQEDDRRPIDAASA
jgi:hypothetical protein